MKRVHAPTLYVRLILILYSHLISGGS